MYKGVRCIMNISPLLIPSVNHSEVFEMKGEFQVKGKKERHIFLLLFAAPFPRFSLSYYLNGWIFFFPLLFAVC